MKNTVIAFMALAMTSGVARGAETNTQPKIAKGPFEPTVASLTQHQTPDWFRDAKFGIYTHWGPVAVGTARQPAGQSDTWYGRYMYIPGLSGPQYHGGIPSRTTFEDHRKNFGDQAQFGFKDIIPLFKAERFNAEEWADLFEKSGAKFAGTVVIHHDNFAMWDSQVTRWNAVKMGPKRDLTGELERAIHKRGMKFVAAMHHAMTWYYYEPAFAYDAKDPQYSDLYGEPHPPADKDLSKDWCEVEWAPPSERFIREWLAKTVELVDKYKVDLLWHDAAMEHIPEPVRLSMAAHFYNRAAEGRREVVLTYKGGELPQGTAVLDFERGGADNILPMPWLSDTSVGRNFWFYDAGDANSFSITELVQILVDIVSKNGCLLLNVGPHPDGTISQKQRDTLLGIGRWLKANGEAIYATRPWKVFGEGTNPAIRFTSKGDTLYALVLAVPQGAVKIASLGKASKQADKPVARMKLLGSKEELAWVQENDALVVNVPKDLPCEHALAFRIDFAQAAEKTPAVPEDGARQSLAMLGAIRWDAWTRWASETEWGGYEKCLWPKQWHYRVPFYGKIVSDERVEVRSDTQEVMDQEIDYAVKGGLSYWAFGWYHPRSWQSADNMTRSLDLYLKSKHRLRLKYTLILMAGRHLGPKKEWSDTVDYLVRRFKDRNYVKVLGNRPLVYWYDMDRFLPFWGTEAEGRESLRLLRERTKAAGLGDPYMALMCYWPPHGLEQLNQFGLDALSAYVNPPDSEAREQPYADAVALNRWFWEECKKTGKPFIPTVTIGWDYRPMKLPRYLDRDVKNNWFTQATPAELTAHVGGAMNWVRQNPEVCEANAVIIYAWNEISEGGWLVPTLSEDTRRLDAVRRAAAAAENPPVVATPDGTGRLTSFSFQKVQYLE